MSDSKHVNMQTCQYESMQGMAIILVLSRVHHLYKSFFFSLFTCQMQVSHKPTMSVSKYAGISLYEHASMQVCQLVSLSAGKFVSW